MEVLYRLLHRREWPPVLCGSDDEPVQARDVVEYYCTKYNLPRPRSVTREEVERAGLYTMLSNQRVDNALMKKLLQLQLRYPSFRAAGDGGA